MKGLLTAAFAACVLLTSCSRSEEAFESDTPTCMWEYNSKKTDFTKEQCSQARRALKELKIEFDRVIASGKLSELSFSNPNSKYDTWYYSTNKESGGVGLIKNTKISGVRTTILAKSDQEFIATSVDNIGFSGGFGISISLTDHQKPVYNNPSSYEDLPKGSIKFGGGSIEGIEDGIAKIQVLRDELRKL